jgi:hypothetical protein
MLNRHLHPRSKSLVHEAQTEHESENAQTEDEVQSLEVHDVIEDNAQNGAAQRQCQSSVDILEVLANILLPI